MCVRFQSPNPNADGRRPGVFGLVNGLARRGELTDEQERFRLTNNAWYDQNFPNPALADRGIYDPEVNPGATAWFKASARMFIARVDGYLHILASHGVPCEKRVVLELPGRVVYEDDFQVVVVPERPTSADADPATGLVGKPGDCTGRGTTG